jgi:hypothetical protein
MTLRGHFTSDNDGQCQASMVTWGGFCILAIQGTRIESRMSLPELYDDVENLVINVPNYGRVHRGFYEPLEEMWAKVEAFGFNGQPLIVGHSLGGVRAHLAKKFRPDAEIVSYGAPEGADAPFWAMCYPNDKPTRVVNGLDFAPGWPWDGPWTHPSNMVWLHDGRMDVDVDRRAGWCTSIMDHSIDTGYTAALARLQK